MKIFERALEKFYGWLSTSGLKILFALIFLWIGFKIIKKVMKIVNAVFERRNVDVTLASFLDGFMNISLKILLVISIMNYVGISTSGIVALVGSAGIAVGLALKESLSNFGGGVIILFMRPFNVGDFIEGANESGKVEKIGIFHTYMSTVDNKQILIPNGVLANGIITNYTAQDKRRVDHVFSVGYEQDIRTVKNVIYSIIDCDERILRDPEPFVSVSELGESSVDFIVKVWTKTDDYWDVYYDLIEKIKIRFDEENISIPYQQMDIYIKNNKESNTQ